MCILYIISENAAYDNHIVGPKKFAYQYKRPCGLVKELFPDNNWLPFQMFSFEEEFRYPVETNMTDLALRIMKKEKVNTNVINDHPFRYIHNPKLLCSMKENKGELQLLILIKSSVSHFELRDTVRKTWGRNVKSSGRYRTAFLLGYLTPNQHEVDLENDIYGDIIQENFIDAYWNNTYKTIMAFNWAVRYCSNARTVLFLDDDMFINLENLQKYVFQINVKRERVLFAGILSKRSQPVRDIHSKWFVEWHDYPFDYYPDYLAGSVIFTSMYVVKLFQAVFPYDRYFGIDDVYLGIVAYKLNITPSNNLLLDNDNLRNFKNLSRLVANHGFKDFELFMETYLKILYNETLKKKDFR
ncbi:hypothetical protein FSP39_013700 [Pinctada imbricata]|uniref:Hexosyltransferase n=1 Tax=Pinctada imbricata TaxID=66713 RepID=A0AA88YDC7_PINIB|nr:hypothetical protein FSP39_013700 [Pinctada imbricata]